MPYTKISITDKKRLFEAHTKNRNYIHLADELGIKHSTAYAIIKRAIKDGEVKEKQRGGKRASVTKINQQHIDAILNIVESNPEYTLDQIKHNLSLSLPNEPSISKSSIDNALRSQLITMKKLEVQPANRNSVDVKNKRQEFANWILEEGVHRELIFIDEAGFNLWLKRTQGRSRVGERATYVVSLYFFVGFMHFLNIKLKLQNNQLKYLYTFRNLGKWSTRGQSHNDICCK